MRVVPAGRLSSYTIDIDLTHRFECRKKRPQRIMEALQMPGIDLHATLMRRLDYGFQHVPAAAFGILGAAAGHAQGRIGEIGVVVRNPDARQAMQRSFSSKVPMKGGMRCSASSRSDSATIKAASRSRSSRSTVSCCKGATPMRQ
jgi:hypothetical protein